MTIVRSYKLRMSSCMFGYMQPQHVHLKLAGFAWKWVAGFKWNDWLDLHGNLHFQDEAQLKQGKGGHFHRRLKVGGI